MEDRDGGGCEEKPKTPTRSTDKTPDLRVSSGAATDAAAVQTDTGAGK